MTRITSFDLTPFYRNSIGIDRLFDRIVGQLDTAATGGNYPPYDIVKISDDRYEIRIAAAGFRQGEIDIELQDGQLVVRGNQDTDVKQEVEFLHHGISSRSWVRTFQLSEYVEVKTAGMTDGILTIKLERVVPEAMKPKKIQIEYSN